MGLLDGKIAIVTGASRGFGAAVALRFAEEGATVLAVAEVEDELQELAAEAAALPPPLPRTGEGAGGRGSLLPRPVDLSKPAEVDAFAARVAAEHDRLDVLVHGAAILRNRPLADLSFAEFEATMEINFTSMVRLVKGLLPHLLRAGEAGGASVINISSRAGIQGFALETDYCAAKFAMEGFSYSLAPELAERGVAVNLVSPGVRIKPTSVTRAEFAAWPAERRAEYRDPAVMADAFVFLARQNGQGVTGRRFNAFELSERVRRDGYDLGPRDL